MPNIDSGHYFLTALIPVMLRNEIDASGVIAAPVNKLREVLALMATEGDTDPGKASPFARNVLNHFVRLVVIDDVNFNGRVNGGGLIETAREDPSIPQHVDHLTRPYLLFAVDFDINSEGAAEPAVYLDTLWQTMPIELRQVFQHCYGFSRVQSAGDFVHYIRQCQIETTLPFCDYWTVPPPFQAFPFEHAALRSAAAGAVAGIVTFGLVDWVTNRFLAWPLGMLAFLAGGIGLFLYMLKTATSAPFPTAPHSDLKSVLKALYLQRHFVDFAIASQGVPPEKLYAAFADFLSAHRPDAAEPTQIPGVVGL